MPPGHLTRLFYARPSAHLGSLATGLGLGKITRSSGIARFVQGGFVGTFRCASSSTQLDTEMPATITSDIAGFEIDTEPRISTRWAAITEIVAFKRDLLTTDLICLQFQLDDGTFVETDEEMVGYRPFIDAVTSKFDLAPNWWSNVAFPPFTTNMATVWSASS